MSYKPLPFIVTVKESSIEGLGLFATADIPKDTIIGHTHIYIPGNVTGDNWIRLPLGGFYNHSDYPNCKSITTESKVSGQCKYLKSIKDIKAGEELTCSYSMYNLKNNGKSKS
tara:strand:- start:500 stop:838 length:339 start_codon:yes stop_codon:yes gene_type:complete